MSFDENGGICLIKHLTYYTYDSITTGCTCHGVLTHIDEYIYLGTYVTIYKNQNKNYSIDVNNQAICVNLGEYMSAYNFFEYYINLLVTTGYIGYNGATTEERVIFDAISSNFYTIKTTNNCSAGTKSSWAIIDTSLNPESIWSSGTTTYFYDEIDSCDKKTGNSYVKLKDLNPSSTTYGETKIILKCNT